MSAPAFRLLETMRWEGEIALLDRHLARLAASAAFFGFAYVEERVCAAVTAAVRRADQLPPPRQRIASAQAQLRLSPSDEGDSSRVQRSRGGSERERGEWIGARLRLRLLLSADGTAEVEATPLDPENRMRRAVVHPEPVAPGGPFWRHKTTHRPHYEGPYRQARAVGFDEAVLLDGDGRVVEGTRTTVWVARDGRLLTPPLTVGGLPGVHRAHLLATRPEAAETVLTAADLLTAEAVYLANAVRGLQPVTVAAPDPL